VGRAPCRVSALQAAQRAIRWGGRSARASRRTWAWTRWAGHGACVRVRQGRGVTAPLLLPSGAVSARDKGQRFCPCGDWLELVWQHPSDSSDADDEARLGRWPRPDAAGQRGHALARSLGQTALGSRRCLVPGSQGIAATGAVSRTSCPRVGARQPLIRPRPTSTRSNAQSRMAQRPSAAIPGWGRIGAVSITRKPARL